MSKPANDNAALRAVSDSTNQFSSAFFQAVAEQNRGNLITSPLSAAVVLSMTAYGARGETERQLKNVLRLPSQDNVAKSGFQSLMDSLNNVGNVELRMANKIYTAKKFSVKPDFNTLIATYFRSASQPVDFANSAEAAKIINSWVENQTNNRIKDLVSAADLDAQTAMILINAVYFKGQWKNKFNARFTQDRTFHVNANTEQKVPTMFRKGMYKYGEVPSLNAKFIELPYKGDELSMVIILPNKYDGLAEVERKLQHVSLTDVLSHGSEHDVDLFLPKFKIESTLDLQDVLQKMGLTNMFTAQADFSGIADADLAVSKVVQKAFIEVNEEGSEAAAATGLGVRPLSSFWSPPKPIEFHVDRPFLSIVKYGDIVLFLANANLPSAESYMSDRQQYLALY